MPRTMAVQLTQPQLVALLQEGLDLLQGPPDAYSTAGACIDAKVSDAKRRIQLRTALAAPAIAAKAGHGLADIRKAIRWRGKDPDDDEIEVEFFESSARRVLAEKQAQAREAAGAQDFLSMLLLLGTFSRKALP